jgi:hypothetical protein
MIDEDDLVCLSPFKKVLEPLRAQLIVSNRVLNILVAEVQLDSAGVSAGISQTVAGRVA